MYIAPFFLNRLPVSLEELDSVETFQSKLKIFKLQQHLSDQSLKEVYRLQLLCFHQLVISYLGGVPVNFSSERMDTPCNQNKSHITIIIIFENIPTLLLMLVLFFTIFKRTDRESF